MTEKKRVYESDVIALPPLKLVPGDAPSSQQDRRAPNGRRRGEQQTERQEEIVQRIIRRLNKD